MGVELLCAASLLGRAPRLFFDLARVGARFSFISIPRALEKWKCNISKTDELKSKLPDRVILKKKETGSYVFSNWILKSRIKNPRE